MDLDRHIRRLAEHSRQHLIGTPDYDYHIQLKLEHSLRVLDNARKIVEGDGITGRTRDLTLLAALYHDIGRFTQYARYRTYNDRESANHARLGVLALRTPGFIDHLPAADQRLIRAAIGLHNVKTLPSSLPEPLNTAARIVRDSDKLDIFPVMITHLGGDKPLDPVVVLGATQHPTRYTQSILQDVLAGRTGSYSEIRWSNDFKMLVAGWINDFNTETGLDLLARSGNMEKLLALLPDIPEIIKLKHRILNQLHYKMPSSPC